jgi:hypothetical protein
VNWILWLANWLIDGRGDKEVEIKLLLLIGITKNIEIIIFVEMSKQHLVFKCSFLFLRFLNFNLCGKMVF